MKECSKRNQVCLKDNFQPKAYLTGLSRLDKKHKQLCALSVSVVKFKKSNADSLPMHLSNFAASILSSFRL